MIFRTVKKYFSLRTYKTFRTEFCNLFFRPLQVTLGH